MTKFFGEINRILKEREKLVEARRKIAQSSPSGFEIAAYMALPGLLIAAGAMPSAAVFFMPAVFVMLYLLYRRFGAYFPLSIIAVYGAAALTLNYDELTVFWLCLLLVGLCGLIFAVRIKDHLASAVIAVAAAAVGMLIGAGIITAAVAPVPEAAADYLAREAGDPVISYLVESAYDSAEIDGKIERSDDGYAAAATEYAQSRVGAELDGYVPYYCINIGATVGLIGFFFAVALNRASAGAYDRNVTEPDIAKSVMSLGGAYRQPTAIGGMRIKRTYLLAVFLPAFIVCIVSSIFGLDALSATVMHALITVPGEFAFVTFAAYVAGLFCGKGKIIAYIVFGLVMAVALVFPIAAFVFSIFGICDILINLRYWIEYIGQE